MPDGPEAQTADDLLLRFLDDFLVELENRPAIDADDMIVMFLVSDFVKRLAAFLHQGFLNHTRGQKNRNIAINGRGADFRRMRNHPLDQLLHVEMRALPGDHGEDLVARLAILQLMSLDVNAKPALKLSQCDPAGQIFSRRGPAAWKAV